MNAAEIREKILLAIPPGTVTPRHTETAHFYEINDSYVRRSGIAPPVYPSVTGKLQVLKDPSIANYKMNRAIDYIAAHFHEMNRDNIMEYLANAKNESKLSFEEAGRIGTMIHDCREEYMKKWIADGKRPPDILSFIPPEKYDIRANSALSALSNFIDDYNYRPVFCELLVWSHRWKVAGTLDDLGIIQWEGKDVLVLLDLKTSNQFKAHYFFQVAMYYDMLKQIFKTEGIKIYIDKAIILKVSKEDRTYKIEDLQSPSEIASYARSMLRCSEGLEMIEGRRKDNQKNVLVID